MQRDYYPTDGWQKKEPKALGMNPEKLKELEPVIKAKYGNINGIVVVRKRYVAFERYYNGYGPFDAHHVASVTKSVLSALVGIAIDNGFIKSIEQRVLDFFPEYTSSSDDLQKRNITLRHLLTMTAPFPFSWKEGDKIGNEPLDRLRRQRNWIMYILNLMGQKGQLGQFQYYTAGTHLLSAIITRTTGLSAREFANKRLFVPIGMREIPDYEMKSFGLEELFGKNIRGWVKDPNGNNTGGWGLTLTPLDMARFGLLYLDHGAWGNQQIISKSWMDVSTDKAVTIDAKVNGYSGYGYLWWFRETDGISAFSALGDGGNAICCIPEKDLVVAIASNVVRRSHDSFELLEKVILPAVVE